MLLVHDFLHLKFKRDEQVTVLGSDRRKQSSEGTKTWLLGYSFLTLGVHGCISFDNSLSLCFINSFVHLLYADNF